MKHVNKYVTILAIYRDLGERLVVQERLEHLVKRYKMTMCERSIDCFQPEQLS